MTQKAGTTELLERMRTGDDAALKELVATLYDELHQIAARRLRAERSGHSWQATALVNEAYLKLVGGSHREFVDRVHFLAVASRVMRQLLVDHARARATKKRMGDQLPPVDWTANLEIKDEPGLDQAELLDLDTALHALAQEDPHLVQLIEMRYFGGMTAEEIAGALEQSVHVVRHDMRFAQAWLRRHVTGQTNGAG